MKQLNLDQWYDEVNRYSYKHPEIYNYTLAQKRCIILQASLGTNKQEEMIDFYVRTLLFEINEKMKKR